MTGERLEEAGGALYNGDLLGTAVALSTRICRGAIPGQGVLAAQHISKSYNGARTVDDVSLFVRRGEMIGVLGPNGAGKTSLFQALAGVSVPDAGQILLDGSDITRLPLYARARQGISYLQQEPSLFGRLTVEQNLLLVLESYEPRGKKRQERLHRLMASFGILHLGKTAGSALSGGERRRCEIARAMAGGPTFLLLDEPFAGVDPIALSDIQALIRDLTRQGVGLVITDHNVRQTLGLIDRAYVLEAGRVLAHGDVDAVVANPMVRDRYLGADFSL